MVVEKPCPLTSWISREENGHLLSAFYSLLFHSSMNHWNQVEIEPWCKKKKIKWLKMCVCVCAWGTCKTHINCSLNYLIYEMQLISCVSQSCIISTMVDPWPSNSPLLCTCWGYNPTSPEQLTVKQRMWQESGGKPAPGRPGCPSWWTLTQGPWSVMVSTTLL